LLFSFLGAILPAWRHHLTDNFTTVGNYFLSLNLGILTSAAAAGYLVSAFRLARVLIVACALASAAFFFLALVPPTAGPIWRSVGIFWVGCGAGLLNSGVFYAISPSYRHDPAATVNLAGTFFGLGCVVVALLVAGTFYVYTVPSILIFIALIPAYFAGIYALAPLPSGPRIQYGSWKRVAADFRSPGAVLFTLLLFFQFGNEWAIAGWLPLFLIKRLGVSPESSLIMLALYWLALLAGRIAALSVLPIVRHGRLLTGSVVAAMFGCAILISTNNRFGAVMGILLVGAGFAPVYPLVVEKIGGRFPHYHPGFFNGLFSFAVTGGLLAPWSLGLLAEVWGIRVVMALPLVGTVLVFLLLLLIWAEARVMGAHRE
jgi:fucose permease